MGRLDLVCRWRRASAVHSFAAHWRDASGTRRESHARLLGWRYSGEVEVVKATVAARVVGVSLGSSAIYGMAASRSRAAWLKFDIGSLAMIMAASASPRASVSAVVYSPGLKRG